MSDDLYGIQKRWKMQPPTYQGDVGIVTEDGLYVCSVPHEVAEQIVRDHNDATALRAEGERLIDSIGRIAERRMGICPLCDEHWNHHGMACPILAARQPAAAPVAGED